MDAGAPTAPRPPLQRSPVLREPVGSLLARTATPIGAAMLCTFLFQVVDTWFVAQLGNEPLTALAFAASVYFVLVALCMGVGVGVSAMVGAALGKGDLRSARQITAVALGSVSVLTALLSAAGIASADWSFALLGAEPGLVPLIGQYMSVIFIGLPVLMVSLLANAAVGATGDTLRPALVFMAAGVINVALDYALIFGIGPVPALGLRGAALATVVSWVFTAGWLGFMLHAKQLLALRWEPGWTQVLGQIVRFSAPAVVGQLVHPLRALLLTTLAARAGMEVVAAVGVAGRVEALALVGIAALNIAVVPLVAQNQAARLPGRTRSISRRATGAAFMWGCALALLLVVFAGEIAQQFSSDAEIVRHTVHYFWAASTSYGFYGVVLVVSAVLNGLGESRRSLGLLVFTMLVVSAPLMLLGARFGPWQLFLALSVGNVVGAAAALSYLLARGYRS